MSIFKYFKLWFLPRGKGQFCCGFKITLPIGKDPQQLKTERKNNGKNLKQN